MTRSLFSPAYGRLRAWLIDARHANRVTQAELSLRLGRPQSFVSKYERGERRLDFVEVLEITEALGGDPHDLVRQVGGSKR